MDLPPQKRVISRKWVHIVKLLSDGSHERFKTRLVIRGFPQQYEIDYQEVFVSHSEDDHHQKCYCSRASKGWDLFQLDVNNAFLYRDLDEQVYMEISPWYSLSSQQGVQT